MASNPDLDLAPGPIVTASPPLRELAVGLVVYPLGALFFGGMISMGLDQLFPSFLSETDFAANRVRMAVVMGIMLVVVVAWAVRTNRRGRHYRVFADRVSMGSPAHASLRFDEIDGIRVGAPMPKVVRGVGRLNKALGLLSRSNRRAAQGLERSYASTVVVDAASGSLVLNLGTVAHGQDLLDELLKRNPGKLVPSEFSDAERDRFGRFVPGWYGR